MKKIILLAFLFIFAAVFVFSAATIYNTVAVTNQEAISLPNTDRPQVPSLNDASSVFSTSTENATSSSYAISASTTVVVVKPESFVGPQMVAIPSISVNAEVERVGINYKGSMATPTHLANVGWYGAGVQPGNPGNAVIAGHVNNGLGLDGVFAHLNKVQMGDDVLVTGSDGKILHFKVSSIQTYSRDIPSGTVFNSPDQKPRVVLITCQGEWIPSDKTYSERLVVFADLVN